MLAIIETIVTRRSNPTVHRVEFGKAVKYRQQNNRRLPAQQQTRPSEREHANDGRRCRGCGSTTHGENQQEHCPAWGRMCNNCSIRNHFASVCGSGSRGRGRCYPAQQQGRSEQAAARAVSEEGEFANALIARLKYDEDRGSYTSVITVNEIPATLKPILRYTDNLQARSRHRYDTLQALG